MVSGIDADVWLPSAPKMEGASIFLHVASGILKKSSQEAEKFEKWWRWSRIFGLDFEVGGPGMSRNPIRVRLWGPAGISRGLQGPLRDA